MAVRSFMYVLESSQPGVYSMAREFAKEGVLGLGPPWLDKKRGHGLTPEEEKARLRAPPGPKWGWEHEHENELDVAGGETANEVHVCASRALHECLVWQPALCRRR
jgi:hypothetical protein